VGSSLWYFHAFGIHLNLWCVFFCLHHVEDVAVTFYLLIDLYGCLQKSEVFDNFALKIKCQTLICYARNSKWLFAKNNDDLQFFLGLIKSVTKRLRGRIDRHRQRTALIG